MVSDTLQARKSVSKVSENGFPLYFQQNKMLITAKDLLISDCLTTDTVEDSTEVVTLVSDVENHASLDDTEQGDFTNGIRFHLHKKSTDKAQKTRF